MQRKCAWCGKDCGEKCPACGSTDVLPVLDLTPGKILIGDKFVCMNEECSASSPFPAGELVGQVTHGLCDECQKKNLELADGPAAQVRA